MQEIIFDIKLNMPTVLKRWYRWVIWSFAVKTGSKVVFIFDNLRNIACDATEPLLLPPSANFFVDLKLRRHMLHSITKSVGTKYRRSRCMSEPQVTLIKMKQFEAILKRFTL